MSEIAFTNAVTGEKLVATTECEEVLSAFLMVAALREEGKPPAVAFGNAIMAARRFGLCSVRPAVVPKTSSPHRTLDAKYSKLLSK